MKKKLSVSCILLFFLLIFTCSVHADTAEFEYSLQSDGTAMITACNRTGDIVIPSQIDGYTVTRLMPQLFYGEYGITSVSIPATVGRLGIWDYVFSYCRNLTAIYVDSANPELCSVDGVLFSKDKSTLYNWPAAKTARSYHIPASVETVCCTAFAGAKGLQNVYFDAQFAQFMTYTFFDCGHMTVWYTSYSYTGNIVRNHINNGLSHESDSYYPVYRALSYDDFGWQENNGKWSYYADAGLAVTGWNKIDGKWYFFDEDGIMKTGWILDDNAWYFTNASGVMQTGWLSRGTNWYYLNAYGVMKTGWLALNGKWYYFDPTGVMQTGWVKVSGKWYYLDASGAMKTGWLKDAGKWYYLDASGAMKTGWLKDGGVWYYLDASGAMVTGTRTIGGVQYTFASNGAML